MHRVGRFGFSRGRAGALLVALAQVVLASAQEPGRIERLNQAFLEHVADLGPQHALAVETIRGGWQETYRDQSPESFVPEALAVLYPAFAETLRAFDDERADDVVRLAGPLRTHADPYVRANAVYLYARALVARGLLEEAEEYLATAVGAEADLAAYTPYAPHLWLLKGHCQARNLHVEPAMKSLEELRTLFPDVPEPVQFAARQLRLEIQRREQGTLEEVATLMTYAADRLKAADATQRVRDRQERIVALLDDLIKEAEQREQSQSSTGGGLPKSAPGQPARASRAPQGPGRVGDLHEVPAASPGEAWGRLPPAERERILQSLRERFPSRYRQLVEQYYRSLAEQKE
jgi:tetratricopeptide (TPR) repeat protein